MKRLYFTFIVCMLLEPVWMSLHAQDSIAQVVRTMLYRLERQDSCLVLDMNIDLSGISLIPDCSVYLYPWLRNGIDSLMLAPVMLNGPQSDLMYRRRKALGTVNKIEKLPPYVVLREGDHPLPCINYHHPDLPYQSWMDSAKVVLSAESYNADARLIPFNMRTETIPPMIIVKVDTVIIHDTLRIEKQVERLVTAPHKETIIEHAGYRADIYFPVGGMKILPEHELNREAWHTFVSELDSLRLRGGNIVLGITVTGYSSPEGSYAGNDRLAKRRAQALKSFLDTKYNSDLVEIRTEWMAEDWDRLVQFVRSSNMADKYTILDIIENVDVFKGREEKLKALSGGRSWRYMLKEYFPKLRCASCRIGYLKKSEKLSK